MAYHINSSCFRGAEIDEKEKFDLLLLGDSFFFGVGVPEKDILARRLENDNFSVLNAAENATNPPEYLLRLKKLYAGGVRASQIAVGLFVGNDFQGISGARNIDELAEYQPPTEPDEFWQLPRVVQMARLLYYRKFRPNDYFIRRYSFLRPFRSDWLEWYSNGDLKKVNAARMKRYHPVSSDPEYLDLAKIDAESVQNVQAILKEISRVDPDASLIVLVIPDLHFVKGELGAAYTGFYRDFVSKLSSDFVVLDLHGKLDMTDFFPNDGHWNAQGHRKVTLELQPILKDRPANPESRKLAIPG